MPAWTVDASGTQTATISTEHSLDTPTTNGTYALEVDTVNLVNGDLVELRVYDMVDGTNYRQVYKGTYQHIQINNAKLSPVIYATTQAKFTLKQTAGTGRAFPWKVLRDSSSQQTGDAYARVGAPVGASISADIAAAPATLLDQAAGVETNMTLRQGLRLFASALLGKASGLATTTAVFRDTNDTKNRISATVDSNGNRSAVTLDGT